MRCKSWLLEAGQGRVGLSSRAQSIVQQTKLATNIVVTQFGPNWVEIAYDWPDDGPRHYKISEHDLFEHGLSVWKNQKHGINNPLDGGEKKGNRKG